MKKILQQLFEHQTLSREDASAIIHSMARGEMNPSQMASFLTVFLMRPVHVNELLGFRDGLLELCVPVDFSMYNAIDLCGTGGDGRNTFNISTLASIVVAGAGYKVAKHGNYGVSSVSGSSNVMEYFGYKFSSDTNLLTRQMEECGICFLHAPLFHPAMKNVAPVRKVLGVKTFFNMLGPLVNPSKPKYQLTGVFSLELARLYQYLLQQTDTSFAIIHSLDGYDEVSLTSAFKFIDRGGEQLLHPNEMGFETATHESLFGGDSIEQAATLLRDVLEGKGTQIQQNVVCTNAAFAIQLLNEKQTFADALEAAGESLRSKRALKSFEKLIAYN